MSQYKKHVHYGSVPGQKLANSFEEGISASGTASPSYISKASTETMCGLATYLNQERAGHNSVVRRVACMHICGEEQISSRSTPFVHVS